MAFLLSGGAAGAAAALGAGFPVAFLAAGLATLARLCAVGAFFFGVGVVVRLAAFGATCSGCGAAAAGSGAAVNSVLVIFCFCILSCGLWPMHDDSSIRHPPESSSISFPGANAHSSRVRPLAACASRVKRILGLTCIGSVIFFIKVTATRSRKPPTSPETR